MSDAEVWEHIYNAGVPDFSWLEDLPDPTCDRDCDREGLQP
jgi:hypothetical protein